MKSVDIFELIIAKQTVRPQKQKLVTYLNPYSYLISREDTTTLLAFDEIHIDGIALVFFLKLFGIVSVERVSFDMSSFAQVLFHDAVKSKRSLYFVGSKEAEIAKAVQNIQQRFPELNIVGFHSGFFDDDRHRAHCLETINKDAPDIVVCGMGTPHQEQFLIDLVREGWQGEGYTCGGFLHQSAQKLDYYPHWINHFHLRWLYRLVQEPRLIVRYGWEYPKFVFYFVTDYLRWKFKAVS